MLNTRRPVMNNQGKIKKLSDMGGSSPSPPTPPTPSYTSFEIIDKNDTGFEPTQQGFISWAIDLTAQQLEDVLSGIVGVLLYMTQTTMPTDRAFIQAEIPIEAIKAGTNGIYFSAFNDDTAMFFQMPKVDGDFTGRINITFYKPTGFSAELAAACYGVVYLIKKGDTV